MRHQTSLLNRRRFLAAAGAGLAATLRAQERAADEDRALIAITFDLEMSRNFPTWDQTHWDYDKGNLNVETKRYTVEACRRVRARGGVLHCFMLGRTLEQENIDWLRGILRAGHPVGNHTYDHVNVRATRPEDIQYRFQRAPWLIAGQPPRQVIRENIRLTSLAMRTRLGIDPAGFRTPGGFANGLADRPDVQQLLQDLGFTWVSSKYPAHPLDGPGQEPSQSVLDGIVMAQAAAQPFVYPRGLVEVPMSPISDIGAFRGGRWRLDWFLRAIRLAVEWAIEHRAVFDFLGHPSCLYVTDPQLRTVDLILDLVRQAGRRAALVDLGVIARRARRG
jgi:peptidoglycan/xylan/chitin deacetylase (PgdA/CDA1 family)